MNSAASAFKTVVDEIAREIWSVWQSNPNQFAVHPAGHPAPRNRAEFRKMFQAEINDAKHRFCRLWGIGDSNI